MKIHILMGTTPVENFTKDGMGQTGCLRWTFTTLTMDIPNHTNPHKHIWQRGLNGKWSPGKPTNLNDDDKKGHKKGKEMLIKLIIQ